MNFNLPSPLVGLSGFIGFVVFLATIVVHVMFCIGVWNDAKRLEAERRNQLVPAMIWALATLFGGVFVAAVYWFLHHSNLFDNEPPKLT